MATKNPPIDVPAVDDSGRFVPDWYDRLKYLDGLQPLSSIVFPPDLTAVRTVKKQVFAAGGTYTPSTGMLYCIIECVAPGGGGGGTANAGANNTGAGGGGGGGGYSRLIASAADIGVSKAVTIGALGTGGAAGNNAGSDGGDTSVGSLCIAKGGKGGGGSSGSTGGVGGAGGVAGTGDFIPAGQAGDDGFGLAGTSSIFLVPCGKGGNPAGGYGNGATTRYGAGAGHAASGYGGGGGGAYIRNNDGAAAGGNGTAGIVVITEFCSQ